MNEFHDLKNNFKLIEKKIGLSFENKDILFLSFVHRSYVNENKRIIDKHNERLEFLGDTVLNLVISAYLYNALPDHSEGELSHIRSRLINAQSCAKYYKMLGLSELVLLGKGEKIVERGKDTIYSDAFEALIGAIYLDKGFLTVQEFILKNFEKIFKKMVLNPEMDFKGKLQEFSQRKYQSPPEYKVLKEEGPEHLKTFYIAVFINNKEVGHGTGQSKKLAEQLAAEDAYKKLNVEGCDG